jgi:hypothetical protein
MALSIVLALRLYDRLFISASLRGSSLFLDDNKSEET